MRIVKFEIKMDILDLLNRRIKEYENSMEECVQELEDEERATVYEGKIEALNELKAEIKDNIDLKKLLGTIEIS